MRPIIRRSQAATASDPSLRAYRPPPKKLINPNAEEKGIARRHARIPEMLTTSYTLAPSMDSRNRNDGMAPGSGLLGAGSGKMKSYKKKLLLGQAISRRV